MANGTHLPSDFETIAQQTLHDAQKRIADKKSTGFSYMADGKLGSRSPAEFIDHTILKPDATHEQILKLCEEAKRWKFKAVCIRPEVVSLVAEALQGTPVEICSVICFPEGTQSTQEKLSEGKAAISAGAQELDYVINYPQLIQKSYDEIYAELSTLVRELKQIPTSKDGAGKGAPAVLKLILENSQLQPLDIVAGTLLAAKAGFDFVKTSTGFKGEGAQIEDVELMKEVCEIYTEGEGNGRRVLIKAAGGIRNAEEAMAMLNAGADRLGTSRSVAIMGGGGV